MINIGKIIKSNREKLGYSQEELSFGICSTGNLSKIESGFRVPTRATFEALMERMGQPSGLYPSFLSTKDKQAYELQHDFNELYSKGDYDKAEKILNKLDDMPELEMAYEHFVRLSRILIRQQKNVPIEEIVKDFERVIDFIIKDFSIDKIRRSPLAKTEINILNAYAIALHEAGNVDAATKIYYELIKWIDNHVVDMESITIVYTQILYNLSKYIGMSGDDHEAVRLCDEGIRLCIRYNRFTHFGSLLYNKGYGLMRLGKVLEAHKCIRETYYICSALGDAELSLLNHVKKFAEKNGIDLI